MLQVVCRLKQMAFALQSLVMDGRLAAHMRRSLLSSTAGCLTSDAARQVKGGWLAAIGAPLPGPSSEALLRLLKLLNLRQCHCCFGSQVQ
jgi:hypothetical protein